MSKKHPRTSNGFLKKVREFSNAISDHTMLQAWRSYQIYNWSNGFAVLLNALIGSMALVQFPLPPLISLLLIVTWLITTVIAAFGVFVHDPLREVLDLKFMKDLRDYLNSRQIPVKLDRRVAQQAAVELSLLQLNALLGKDQVGSLSEKMDQLLTPLTGDTSATLGIHDDVCTYTVYCYNTAEDKMQAVWKEWDDDVKNIERDLCSKEHNIAGTACWNDSIDIIEDSSSKPHDKLFTGSSAEKTAQRKYWRSYIAIPVACTHPSERAPRFPVVFVITSNKKGRFTVADFDGVARNYRQILSIYFSRLPRTAWPSQKVKAEVNTL